MEPVSAPHPDDVPGEAPAGHSHQGDAFNEGPRQAGGIIPGTGLIEFPVTSSSPKVRPLVEQGIGQLHGYWYFEAERSFRQAAVHDPDCAICYWGMSLANAGNSTRAKGFIEKAMRLRENASEREQDYIEVHYEYMHSTKGSSDKAKQYVSDLQKLSAKYPQDLEALAWYSHVLYKNRSRVKKKYEDVDAVLNRVLARNPAHPVHHYRIHLWDYKSPKNVLNAAAECGPSAPGIAHMWHMPGHTYSRLHRYSDAAWQQEASARVDHAHMIRYGLLPDQIHNYAHNNEWLIRNLVYLGQPARALAIAENLASQPRHPRYNTTSKRRAAYYGRQRLMQVIQEFELWSEADRLMGGPLLEAGTSETDRMADAKINAMVALHQNRTADLNSILDGLRKELAAAEEKKKADEEKRKDSKDKKKSSGPDPTARLLQTLRWIEGNQLLKVGEPAKALEALKVGKADAMLLADAETQAGKHDDAIRRIEADLKRRDRQVLPFAKGIEILWRAGARAKAATYLERLRLWSHDADPNLPQLRKLDPIAKELGLPERWRIRRVMPGDLGERPDHDTLGPIDWKPGMAPGWELTDEAGKTHRLAQNNGRPTLIVFYLGFGCLHCAEQIQDLIPLTKQFAEAGIDIVAISTESADQLKRAKGDFDTTIPFPIVCDPALSVFKEYRAFDDFEDLPMHGTFLVDSEGYLRWQDIGHEPFMDLKFLLTESKRLLQIDVPVTPVRAPRPDDSADHTSEIVVRANRPVLRPAANSDRDKAVETTSDQAASGSR